MADKIKGPPNSWYDPPDTHDLCQCENCHEADLHEPIEHWIEEGCMRCEEKMAWAIKNREYCADCKIWWCSEDHLKEKHNDL